MAMWGALGRFITLRAPIPAFCAQHRTFVSLFRGFNQTEVTSSGSGILSRTLPSNLSSLPVRTKKRGMEYQPKFLKRRRTHGWEKRLSTRGGIEVILRRMLKGRKSLTVHQS
ncbi:large ribosomal subunit protein bL34m [Leptodactylus fuscus]|uniref:large ribosomal subunit protein bL34m n=1 Tax=Leptodactylus fuscus TaxID=238119 RepID=UPI003F4ED858